MGGILSLSIIATPNNRSPHPNMSDSKGSARNPSVRLIMIDNNAESQTYFHGIFLKQGNYFESGNTAYEVELRVSDPITEALLIVISLHDTVYTHRLLYIQKRFPSYRVILLIAC